MEENGNDQDNCAHDDDGDDDDDADTDADDEEATRKDTYVEDWIFADALNSHFPSPTYKDSHSCCLFYPGVAIKPIKISHFGVNLFYVKQPAELFQQPPLPQATIKAISPPVTAVAAPPPPPQSTFTPLSTTAAATIPTKKLVDFWSSGTFLTLAAIHYKDLQVNRFKWHCPSEKHNTEIKIPTTIIW
uniref:HDC10625 n=1 Tax=Drosophila melanogaster TaxID=7227 RepID=Q6IL25_DROME|nr:TPA_inf: HDC10625 [Drosophila melanogaster]